MNENEVARGDIDCGKQKDVRLVSSGPRAEINTADVAFGPAVQLDDVGMFPASIGDKFVYYDIGDGRIGPVKIDLDLYAVDVFNGNREDYANQLFPYKVTIYYNEIHS